ncbi:polyprenol phosphomannose-dependent alpha 1,6 mannosyltransferase MptB [Rhizohabitans arisaemae]|uniref:polyprenol phosphomannose-dependent alpha 1,6 mannosyltransferase MptB n=1 Tax=Rhizohabitans arisaemae TaxID=2720610 RepID=UPI0024B108DF|nr:polyprenol phosphomannose-dependent alpha 1,6 mannosyltransferase MptB [Rhizohabitans arisaemae]
MSWLARGGLAVSLGLTVLIPLLGPSAMVPPLPGPAGQPPYSLGLAPSGHLVVALAAVILAAGTAGLGAGLSAVRRGWAPDPRRLLLLGASVAALLAFLPPMGSSDHLNYAAYGRLLVLGHDPYATSPAQLPGDPVVGAVEEWGTVTSVYGPVATGLHGLAALVGSDSVRLTVFVLAVVNAIAFTGTGLLLHRMAAGDPDRQRRAALLWTLNPLLIYHLVAGMHVDTLAVVFAVAALALLGRSLIGSGVMIGLGMAVKLPVGLVSLGPAWELRRAPRRLLTVAVAAAVTVAGLYALAGPYVLDQVGAASKSVSKATPWHLVANDPLLGWAMPRTWVQIGSFALLAVLAALLLRAMPAPYPDGVAARVAVALIVAWLFAAPYALPWYDGLALALLALVPWSALDAFVVARLAVLSFAYLPARQADQPADLAWLVTVVRSQVVPLLLTALLIGLILWAVRAGARARRPSAPAEPRRSAPSPGSPHPSR